MKLDRILVLLILVSCTLCHSIFGGDSDSKKGRGGRERGGREGGGKEKNEKKKSSSSKGSSTNNLQQLLSVAKLLGIIKLPN
jgi:hypothetical protein